MSADYLVAAREDISATLRPVDLARAAGISASLVRLYESEGLIAPATRTASGQRRYSRGHLKALFTARALRSGYSWTMARAAMQAVHRGDYDAALSIANQRHAQLHAEAQRLSRAVAAIDGAGSSTEEVSRAASRPVSIGSAAEILGLTPATLRHWESMGVVRPVRHPNGRRLYTPAVMQQLELVQVLRGADYSFDAIAQLMASLKVNDRVQTRKALATREAQLRRQTRAAAAATGELVQLLSTIEETDVSG